MKITKCCLAVLAITRISADIRSESQRIKIEVVSEVNNRRITHHAPPLNTSKDITLQAQKWTHHLREDCSSIEQCNEDLHSNNEYGEIMYWRGIQSDDSLLELSRIVGEEVVAYWYKQNILYDYEGKCSKLTQCGDFSQLIWVDSKEIGIGVYLSVKHRRLYVVAYFYPKGNILTTDEFVRNVSPINYPDTTTITTIIPTISTTTTTQLKTITMTEPIIPTRTSTEPTITTTTTTKPATETEFTTPTTTRTEPTITTTTKPTTKTEFTIPTTTSTELTILNSTTTKHTTETEFKTPTTTRTEPTIFTTTTKSEPKTTTTITPTTTTTVKTEPTTTTISKLSTTITHKTTTKSSTTSKPTTTTTSTPTSKPLTTLNYTTTTKPLTLSRTTVLDRDILTTEAKSTGDFDGLDELCLT